jgi:uncharacterized protein
MTSWTLDQIPDGQRVFIDASIFIYHFTGASPDCQNLLEDCERGRIAGFTSVAALAEVAHRLMTIEAVAKGLVSPGNVVRKLREKPEIVRELHTYQDQTERIPLMGVAVIELDLEILSFAAGIRQRHGLLVNDSILAATAISRRIAAMASADSDFERVEELQLFRPVDL